MSKFDIFNDFGYLPSPSQIQVHSSEARFCICAAGARFGKSMLAGAECAFNFIFPNRRVWIVGTQYELAEKEFNWALEFLGKFKLDGDDSPILDKCLVRNNQKGSREVIAPWGSFIKTKSTEKPQLLLGEELDLCILSEASQIAKSVWERQLRARLGPRNGRLYAISTPNADGGLFYDFYKRAEAKEEYFACWKFKTTDNPFFDPKEYEKAKRELNESVFKEQYEGEFVSRRGKIFKIENECIIKKMHPDHVHWPIICGYQRGYKNPSVVAFFVVDPQTKQLFLVDEIHFEEKPFSDIVEAIREKISGHKFLGFVTDFWDFEASESLRTAGFHTTQNTDEKKIGRQMAVVKRIQGLQNYLRVSEITHLPKLLIMDKCVKIIDDIEKSKWEEKKEDDRPEQEVPKSKFLQSVFAIAHVIAFLSSVSGGDFYGIR